jgi:hypothetical protein
MKKAKKPTKKPAAPALSGETPGTLSHAIRRYLEAACEEFGVNATAEAIGADRTGLHRMRAGERWPDADKLDALGRLLGLKIIREK